MAARNADQQQFDQLRSVFDEKGPHIGVNPIGVTSLFNAALAQDKKQESPLELSLLANWAIRYLEDFADAEILERTLTDHYELSDLVSGKTVTKTLSKLMESDRQPTLTAAIRIACQAYSYPHLKKDMDALVPKILDNPHVKLGDYARLANSYYGRNEGTYPKIHDSLTAQMQKVDRAMSSLSGRLQEPEYLDADFFRMITNINYGERGELSQVVETYSGDVVRSNDDLGEYYKVFIAVKDVQRPMAFWRHESMETSEKTADKSLSNGFAGKRGMVDFSSNEFFLPPVIPPVVAEKIVFGLDDLGHRCVAPYGDAAQKAGYLMRLAIHRNHDLLEQMSPRFNKSSSYLLPGPSKGGPHRDEPK